MLLLVPLLVLVTPVYNRIEPRVLGFPFFYWYQFLWVPIGVICTSIVYLMTRDDRKARGEGTRGEETRGEETQGDRR